MNKNRTSAKILDLTRSCWPMLVIVHKYLVVLTWRTLCLQMCSRKTVKQIQKLSAREELRAPVQRLTLSLACKQALLFVRAKRAKRERASEWRSCEGPRLLSRASRASTFHDIPQMESLLAGYIILRKTSWSLEFIAFRAIKILHNWCGYSLLKNLTGD